MSTPRDAGRVVIVGGGLAGYSAAKQLRTLGHAGPLALVDPEPTTYDRPPLSKRLFDDDFRVESLAFATPEKLLGQRIDTHFGRRVVGLDPDRAGVRLDDGTQLDADTVLLTTGGRARTLPVPGMDLPGVHLLRTFADAAGIRDRMRAGIRAVVIGAGLVGAEVASALRRAGADVTLIDPMAIPLAPVIGDLLAERLHGLHDKHGVDVIVGVIAGIVPAGERLAVQVDDGPEVTADIVVVGVGMVPNTELAETAGIAVDNGVLVDDDHRTSAPRVYAAGDVARRLGADGAALPREEHWEAAQLSGREAAYSMLGLPAPERGASWFWSDRHGVHLEATGRLNGPGYLVVREGGAHPAVFLVDNGMLVGAAAIDDNPIVRAARRLIDQRIPVSAAELADPTVKLRSLLRAAQ